MSGTETLDIPNVLEIKLFCAVRTLKNVMFALAEFKGKREGAVRFLIIVRLIIITKERSKVHL